MVHGAAISAMSWLLSDQMQSIPPALAGRMGGQEKKSPRRQIRAGAQNLVWDEELSFSRTNKTSSLAIEASVREKAWGVGMLCLTPQNGLKGESSTT